MLKCLNVGIRRADRIILQNLNFTIYQGNALCIYGSNGIGKTSILKVLTGLARPYTGKILYNELDISLALNEHYGSINYIGHKDTLYYELSVLDNLKFWAATYNNKKIMEEVLSYFGLSRYLNTKLCYLSRGWQRKVALSRLLFSQALLWFLDEPFEHLDKDGTEKLSNMIDTKCSQKGIIIFTGHQPCKVASLKIKNLNLEDFLYG